MEVGGAGHVGGEAQTDHPNEWAAQTKPEADAPESDVGYNAGLSTTSLAGDSEVPNNRAENEREDGEDTKKNVHAVKLHPS
jgi:hypothetical protein